MRSLKAAEKSQAVAPRSRELASTRADEGHDEVTLGGAFDHGVRPLVGWGGWGPGLELRELVDVWNPGLVMLALRVTKSCFF